jgi:hypothetical protein
MGFDDALLDRFMRGFFGYGNYRSGFWFIGMEEGGGDSTHEINRRLEAWDERGGEELADAVDYNRAVGQEKWFRPRPPLQPTWSRLIRVLFAAQGRLAHPETVKAFQSSSLGRPAGSNCLIELLPLPSPSSSHWIYADHSGIPCLRSRQAYEAEVAPWRARHIHSRVEEQGPKVVLFYGFKHRDWWTRVAGAPLASTSVPELFAHNNGSTVYALMKHPTATGVSNDYLDAVGGWIRRSTIVG